MIEKEKHPPSSHRSGCHTIVIMQRVGRLGNQIMLFANLIALSLATGIRVFHPVLGQYADYFAGTSGDLLCRYPQQRQCRNRPGRIRRLLIYYICRIADKTGVLKLFFANYVFEADYKSVVDMTQPHFIDKLLQGRYTFLTRGWLYRYSIIEKDDFLRELRRFFALVPPYKTNVERLVARARSGCQVLIGVHIRQTDFKEHAGGKYYFTTQNYEELMKHCQSLFLPAKVAFLVVSDEPHDASDFEGLSCFFGSGVDIEDMYCLGYCDYIVGSIASSYSTWPAVLFQKPTYRMFSPQAKPSLEDFVLTTDTWSDISTSNGSQSDK